MQEWTGEGRKKGKRRESRDLAHLSSRSGVKVSGLNNIEIGRNLRRLGTMTYEKVPIVQEWGQVRRKRRESGDFVSITSLSGV